MFCPYCGSEMADNAVFCGECGASLQDELTENNATPPVHPDDSNLRQTQPATYTQPETTPVSSTAAKMPSTSTAVTFIVIGFLCGVLWGIVGLTQYNGMKRAIAEGDVATANKKASIIKGVTIAGIVLQVLVVLGAIAQS